MAHHTAREDLATHHHALAALEEFRRVLFRSWVYKGEWNSTVTDKLYIEGRYGEFGYYFPLTANTDEQYFWRDTGLQTLVGAGRKTQLDRDLKQWAGAATYFLDTARGSHAIKFGAELLREQSWEGTLQQWGGNIEHLYANGLSSTVVFGLPTATKINSLSANDEGALTARAALDHLGMFVTDTWAIGRFTVIGGLRFDRYRGWLPEQRQLAATVGPVSVAAKTFPEKEFYTWNKMAPRFGLVYDLSGDGKMVVKASYGFFWHNHGIGVSANGNPHTNEGTVRQQALGIYRKAGISGRSNLAAFFLEGLSLPRRSE